MVRSDNGKRKWVILIGILGWLVSLSGVFGNSGLFQAYKLAEVRRDLSLRIRALENERVRLANDLDALQRDPFTQEQAIRETLGLVRENELVFEFR
jgi:cell division protein FtsB